MPIVNSDDDVLGYQPRWQGPPGIARLRRGLLYGSLGAGFITFTADGTLLLVLLLVGPLVALTFALLLTVPLVITGVQQQQYRPLGLLFLAIVGLIGTATPTPVVLLMPFLHTVLVVRAAERYLNAPERTFSQHRAVLNAEAASPRAPRARALPRTHANVDVTRKAAVTRWS